MRIKFPLSSLNVARETDPASNNAKKKNSLKLILEQDQSTETKT